MTLRNGWSSLIRCDYRQRHNLSSCTAANALATLQQLFVRSTLSIPPAVHDEIQTAVDRGRRYLDPLIAAIATGEIATLQLAEEEQSLVTILPRNLDAGERESIALCQQRHIPLLTNDRRAIRYSQAHGIDAVDLPTLLRLFWTRQLVSRRDVEQMISQMEQVERLMLSQEQRAAIFSLRRRRL